MQTQGREGPERTSRDLFVFVIKSSGIIHRYLGREETVPPAVSQLMS